MTASPVHPAEGVGARGTGTWRLDPVPLLLAGTEWSYLERDLVRRVGLLDLVPADVYGPRELIRRRLLPPELVYGHADATEHELDVSVDMIRIPDSDAAVLPARP
jgi:uncharacterized circularly permuted ATP-grasp superfamily protein